jgi:hypothetical protein
LRNGRRHYTPSVCPLFKLRMSRASHMIQVQYLYIALDCEAHVVQGTELWVRKPPRKQSRGSSKIGS